MRHPLRNSAIAALLAVTALLALPANTGAQDYPSRPIKLLVPFLAGGPTDALARVIGQALEKDLGQPIIIDNRGGAGGLIAMEWTATSATDGHTLFFATTGTMSINPSLYKSAKVDPLKALDPVATIAQSSNVLVTMPSFPANNIKDLIALAKEKPGTLTFGSAGPGSTTHLAGELLKMQAGIAITHVPYKGTAAALTDLLGGQISMVFDTISGSIVQYIKSNQVKAIAVTGAARNDALPDVPTITESGLPGFEVTTWYGLAAPAGTSVAIIDKLNGAMKRVLAQDDVRKKLAVYGVAPFPGGTPADFRELMKQDSVKWSDLVKAAGVAIE
ncbi:tripartite tricarboxylate transporter substrate binding protein [Bradyrhizobium sp. dw_411]|uniref:Bug family tripartite tricarboxylate transporter substrate binding protein n=1 Tax=Bradyrhizobium sp. dw_411 TaxID=2720082 RepID=UPI001BCB8CDC|nr:tripartite tricarboxylate transporter substrate binding protein [Bradyrhizobium sp. dw_411]